MPRSLAVELLEIIGSPPAPGPTTILSLVPPRRTAMYRDDDAQASF
jgi:hypothetical protein